MSDPSIVVTGSLAYDHLLYYERPFESMLLPEKLHELSVCFVINCKERYFGGTAGNIAYNFSLMGIFPRIVASVGRDFDPYRQWLRSNGLPLDYVEENLSEETASASIMTDPNGHQIIQFHPGALNLMPQMDLIPLFQTTDLLLIAPEPVPRTLHIVEAANRAKCPYFFDPGQNLPYFEQEDLLRIIQGASGVFMNDYEFELLKSKTHYDTLDLLQQCPLFVVTLGEKGSRIYTPESDIFIPVVSPQSEGNPTGCGDAYRAGFLKGYSVQKNLESCGRLGALLGTYNFEHPGTQLHSPTWEQIMERYVSEFNVAW